MRSGSSLAPVVAVVLSTLGPIEDEIARRSRFHSKVHFSECRKLRGGADSVRACEVVLSIYPEDCQGEVRRPGQPCPENFVELDDPRMTARILAVYVEQQELIPRRILLRQVRGLSKPRAKTAVRARDWMLERFEKLEKKKAA